MSDYPPSTNPFGPQDNHHVITNKRVGFGPRLGAWIIDGLLGVLFGVLLGVLLQPLGIGMTETIAETLSELQDLYQMLGIDPATTAIVEAWYPALTLGGIIGSIMYALIEGLSGASPGKRILGLVVATHDGRTGTAALWMRRCVAKNISTFLQMFTLLPALAFIGEIGTWLGIVIFVGCFFVLGEERLALHDRIAGSAIFDREDVH